MVVGNKLYQVTKNTFDNDYYFNKIGEYSIDNSGNQYSVYSVVSKDKNGNDKKLKLYKNILWNIVTSSIFGKGKLDGQILSDRFSISCLQLILPVHSSNVSVITSLICLAKGVHLSDASLSCDIAAS